MTQLDWLGRSKAMPEPRSRRSDPLTSTLAAEGNRRALKTQAAEVLALIERWPGSTACELAKVWKSPMEYGLKRVAVSRRTADLSKHDLIRRGKPRKCSVRGSLQTTWYAKD